MIHQKTGLEKFQTDSISNPLHTLLLKDLNADSIEKVQQMDVVPEVLSHTSCFRSKIDFIQGKTQSHNK